MILEYQGDGRQHITGIPSRDLTEDEVNALALSRGMALEDVIDDLTAHGLYTLIGTAEDYDDGVWPEVVSEDTD
jgi:2-iminoacetate synthase ThiH